MRLARPANWMAKLTLLVGLGSVGCSEDPPRPPENVPPELESLYGMIRDYRADYEEGIDLILAGEEVTGRNLLAAASDRISVAAEFCARTEGCDMSLFHMAMGQVYVQRGMAAVDAAGVPSDLESDEQRPGGSLTFREQLPPPAPLPLMTAEDLRAMIPLNLKVKAALNDWLTWNRPALIGTYENYQYMRDLIFPIYDEAGLPEALVFAMMAVESGGKVHAYSRAGAAGPLQFMAHTARRYGLGSIDGFDMRLDPVASTRANARYMQDQLRAFDGDLEKALAAYNVGESRMRRVHRKHPDVRYWDATIYYSLPTETRNYVPQVFAAALIFIDPAEYGVSFPQHESNLTQFVLESEMALGELTICLGEAGNPNGWFRTLRNLNPRLRPSQRSPKGQTLRIPSKLVPVYAERCDRRDELMTLAAGLQDAGYPEQPEMIQYTVRRGDTLAQIASRYRCWSTREIAKTNGIKAPDYVIHPGQRLTVPSCS